MPITKSESAAITDKRFQTKDKLGKDDIYSVDYSWKLHWAYTCQKLECNVVILTSRFLPFFPIWEIDNKGNLEIFT